MYFTTSLYFCVRRRFVICVTTEDLARSQNTNRQSFRHSFIPENSIIVVYYDLDFMRQSVEFKCSPSLPQEIQRYPNRPIRTSILRSSSTIKNKLWMSRSHTFSKIHPSRFLRFGENSIQVELQAFFQPPTGQLSGIQSVGFVFHLGLATLMFSVLSQCIHDVDSWWWCFWEYACWFSQRISAFALFDSCGVHKITMWVISVQSQVLLKIKQELYSLMSGEKEYLRSLLVIFLTVSWFLFLIREPNQHSHTNTKKCITIMKITRFSNRNFSELKLIRIKSRKIEI